MKGKLIVLEGTDCSGKETQSNLLVDYLNNNGYPSVKYAFPNYDSPTGKIIAGSYLGKEGYMNAVFPEGASNVDPYCAALLFAMDRKYNINKIIDSLDKGLNVVLDRYVDSNMAHNGAKLNNADRKQFYSFIEKLEYNLLKLPKPDLEIYLHMPIQFAIKLRALRNEKPDQHEQNVDYLLKSENAYNEIVLRHKILTVECVNFNSIKTIGEISKEICNIVVNYLKDNHN